MTAAEAELERALRLVDRLMEAPAASGSWTLPELEFRGAGVFRVIKVPGGMLRALPRTLSPRQLRRAVFAPASTQSAGVFLPGATRAVAEEWAKRFARAQFQRGSHIEVVHDDPHRPGGVPHFHVLVGPRRSAHIFFGPRPAGDFFVAS